MLEYETKVYSYDAFLRNDSTYYPDGFHTLKRYYWSNLKGVNSLYCQFDFQTGNPWTKTYYDALGRETAASGLNLDGTEPCSDKQYNNSCYSYNSYGMHTGRAAGGITHITNSSGSLVQELSYDAWGRLRNPTNQIAYTPDNEPVLFLGRGYTGFQSKFQQV